MGRSAIVIDRDYLKHDPGPDHPERRERIQTLLDLAQSLDPGAYAIVPPRPALREEIESFHGKAYVALIESTSRTNRFALDGDTVTSRDSFAVAVLAAGGFLKLLDLLAAREFQNGMTLARPPGHHALKDRAMGFCLFNTVALGAGYLKRVYGAERILIVDWDVHHGNGTQEAFYCDPSVLYVSLHQYPFYPGTGSLDEVGSGEGEGCTVNIPLPAGCGDEEYLAVFRELVVPIAEAYRPQWILVSAGFDPHRLDPLGGMAVTERGFSRMAAQMLELARKHAGGRIAFLLEGGYNLRALRESVGAVLGQMQRITASEDSAGGDRIQPLVREVVAVQQRYRRIARSI
jgi:acetoin utilization deacetylase AcuC-like enzyme